MGLSAEVNSFSIGATTGTVSVTGVGFQPKALTLFWCGSASTADAVAAGSSTLGTTRGIGLAAATSAQFCVASYGLNNSAAADNGSLADNDIMAIPNGSGAVDGLATLTAFTTDGFNLNVTNNFPVNLRAGYLALGGTDITNADILAITEPGASGAQNYVVGFQPSALIGIGCQSTAALGTALAQDSGLTLGVCSSTSQQGTWCGNSDDGSALMDCDAYIKTGEFLSMITVAGGNPNARATFTGFTTDGFNLSWIRALSGRNYGVLAIKGPKFFADSVAIPATTGSTVAKSGFGFIPSAALVFGAHTSAEDAAGASHITDAFCIGAFTSTTARISQSYFDVDGAANTDLQHGINFAETFESIDASPANVSLGDVSSIDADGFTLIQDQPGGLARFALFLAVGPAGAFAQSLSATAVSVATMLKNTSKTLSATAISVAELLKTTMKTLTATTVSVASMVASRLYSRAMTAISVSVATMTRAMIWARSLSASTVSVATITKLMTYARSLSAVSVSLASMTKRTAKILAGVAVTVATLTKAATYQRILSAASASVATMTRISTRLRTLATTAVSVASITKLTQKTLSAVSATLANLSAVLQAGGLFVTMTATAVSVATMDKAATFARSLSATAVSVASMAKGMFVTLSAGVVSLASLVQQIVGAIIPPPLARFASKLRVNRGAAIADDARHAESRAFRFISAGADRGIEAANAAVAASLNSKVTCYWKLDEASGDRADSKGGMTLTDVNTVTSNPGKQGLAGQFTRANQEYLTRDSEATLQTGDIDFTLACWVYLDSKPGNMQILSRRGANAAATEYILSYASGIDRFQFYIGGVSFLPVTASNFGSPPLSTWIFIVAWHDAANDTVNIQVNNGAVNSVGTGGQAVPATTSRFRIGYVDTGSADYWDGRIDEGLFAKSLLTPAERTFLNNGGTGRTYPF